MFLRDRIGQRPAGYCAWGCFQYFASESRVGLAARLPSCCSRPVPALAQASFEMSASVCPRAAPGERSNTRRRRFRVWSRVSLRSPGLRLLRHPSLGIIASSAVAQKKGRSFERPSHVIDVSVPHEHPVVLPHVSHFMQVPLRTSVKLPHSPHISPS